MNDENRGDLTHSNPSDSESAAPAAKLPKIIPFSTLAPCGDEIWIENNGQLYRLRRTSQGKLILTK
ncbi:MAG: hemin uptake protein HemP [Rubripirellula sp.]|nr:hemin uptake protein HemP [Planctomycetaceae bacterium]MDF1844232.1 hemin uptake protein HemP [Rubripirellula sp.]